MLLSAPPVRSIYRQSPARWTRSPRITKRLGARSSFPPPLFSSYNIRFNPQGHPFAKSVQVCAFSSLPDRDDEFVRSGKSKKQQIEQLLEENAALKTELEKLKAEANKTPSSFLGKLQQYGLPFFVWWTSLYVASGVSIYVALDMGLLSGASIIEFIMQIGLDKVIDPARLDPTYGNIAIAVIANECLEVVRFPLTLATLPYVKRIFSRSKVDEESK